MKSGTNKQTLKNGFTIIETTVAIGIIVIGLIAALGAITAALFYVSNIQDRIIAANLVAEGIEIVRNIRDNNRLQNLAWNNDLADGNYQTNFNSTSLSSYNGNFLLLDPSTGLYNYNSGNPTYFLRKISIANLSNYEIRIISTVIWQKRGINYINSAEDHLFNWKIK